MNKKLTVTEMRHKKEALRGSLKALQNKAKVESRELTSEED
jgi:hypothetical protein